MKDKAGNELTLKEFMTRWKAGIKAITPTQQSFISLIGNYTILIGVLIGIYATFITRSWWIFIVLVGSLIILIMGIIGGHQKHFALKEIDTIIKLNSEQEVKNV